MRIRALRNHNIDLGLSIVVSTFKYDIIRMPKISCYQRPNAIMLLGRIMAAFNGQYGCFVLSGGIENLLESNFNQANRHNIQLYRNNVFYSIE